MGLHILIQRCRWGRFGQADAGYWHASSADDNASFPCMFLVLEIPLLLTITHSTRGNAIFCHWFPLWTHISPFLAWQNTEYFEIPYHKWRIFYTLLNAKISFTEDIINATVMFYHFQHEEEYCNSDPILWVEGIYIIPLGVVTCHTNSASNICDHSASYFTAVFETLHDTTVSYENSTTTHTLYMILVSLW